jgi:hypothetical protein
MTTITLSPELSERVERDARTRGQEPTAYLEILVATVSPDRSVHPSDAPFDLSQPDLSQPP